MKNIAIVLAGGKGSRMNSDVPKQYMDVHGKPILYYSLKVFENSFIDEIILVAGEEYIEYCKENIVDKYDFKKITKIILGGEERFHSVYNGLMCIPDSFEGNVFIHDGARPCINEEILAESLKDVQKYKACITAVPVKDTIKVIDDDGFAVSTPDRSSLWQIQTPQTFLYKLIKDAYTCLMKDSNANFVTDDAMVVEKYGNVKVKISQGSYNNIKVTTTEDMAILEQILKK